MVLYIKPHRWALKVIFYFFTIEKVTYNEKLTEWYNEPPGAQL